MRKHLHLVHDSMKCRDAMTFREALQRLDELGYRHLPAMEDSPGEATKDDIRGWHSAPGQQPPLTPDRRQGSTRTVPDFPEALAETTIALAQAEREVSRREVELLRQRLADSQAERERLHELLREALVRPSLLERLLRAVRGAAKSPVGEAC